MATRSRWVYGPGWLHPNLAIFTVVTIRSNAEIPPQKVPIHAATNSNGTRAIQDIPGLENSTSHQVPSGAQGFAAPPSEIIEVDEGWSPAAVGSFELGAAIDFPREESLFDHEGNGYTRVGPQIFRHFTYFQIIIIPSVMNMAICDIYIYMFNIYIYNIYITYSHIHHTRQRFDPFFRCHQDHRDNHGELNDQPDFLGPIFRQSETRLVSCQMTEICG